MDKPQSQRDAAPPRRNSFEKDRGFAPGGGYSDASAAPFPEDDYRWRTPPADGYGGQEDFDRFPKDQQQRTAGGGERDRPDHRRPARSRSWHGNSEGHAQAAPGTVKDTDDVGYHRRAY